MEKLSSELENQYISESNPLLQASSHLMHSKPRNTLDYLAYESEEYCLYKLTELIKSKIEGFNFDNKIIQEIISLCIAYQPQVKLSILLPMIIYKIVQKYNFPFTKQELLTKINLSKSHYLKYSTLIQFNTEIKRSYKEDVNKYIQFAISKIIDSARNKPRIIKDYYSKDNKKEAIRRELEELSDQFIALNNGDNKTKSYEDIEEKFKKVKMKCKEFVYNDQCCYHNSNNDDDLYMRNDNFNNFFEGKINDKHLAIAIVKMIMKQCRLSINVKDLKDVFSVSMAYISKATLLLKEYTRLNGLVIYMDD